MRRLITLFVFVVVLFAPAPPPGAEGVEAQVVRADVERALRKAAEFYWKKVSTQAGYPDSWSRTWPGPDYRSLYTFNDNTISDLIDMFFEAWRIYGEDRYRRTAEKGGDFILLAQMPEPQPAWAQQYDVEMRPAWARLC